MKHSSAGLMSETCDSKTMQTCNGNWNNVFSTLYVDLFNLIVESRMPGINERGYGNGHHCPPLFGQNGHKCDLMKPECLKHQRMIHHLMQAVRQNVFEIEVLMLPECCSDSKLSERIQKNEYVLLERWSMKFMQCDNTQTGIDIKDLLRAVHSFLHFSQISAWLSSSKGKSPANVYYWVKPSSDISSTPFESNPEVHSFPMFKVNDELNGIVQVDFPARKQYIPIIPCSKHPPLQGLRIKLSDDANLASDIPLNHQIVKHLQNNCDTQQSIITISHCATVSDPPKQTMLKSVPQNLTDINKESRVLKHSNSRVFKKNSFNSRLKSSCKDILPLSGSTLINNYKLNLSNCSSQENLFFNSSYLTNVSPRKETKLNLLNKVLLPSFCETVPTEIALQTTSKQNELNNLKLTPDLINSETCIISSPILTSACGTNGTASDEFSENKTISNHYSNCVLKPLKRKPFLESEKLQTTPSRKRAKVFKGNSEIEEKLSDKLQPLFCQNIIQKQSFKRKLCNTSNSSKKIAGESDQVLIKNYNFRHSNIKERNNDSFKVTSSGEMCVITQNGDEKIKHAVEICLGQKWNGYASNMLCHEQGIKLYESTVTKNLVSSSVQNGCANQMLSKNINAKYFSHDCDNCISAKSTKRETANYKSSKLTSNESSPLKSFFSTKKAFQYCRTCLKTNNKTDLGIKAVFKNKKLWQIKNAKDLGTTNISVVSQLSHTKEPSDDIDMTIKTHCIKKRSKISNKSHNFQKPHECPDWGPRDILKKLKSKYLKFNSPTTESSTTNCSLSSPCNISFSKGSKLSVNEKYCKHGQDNTSISWSNNQHLKKAKYVKVLRDKEKYKKKQINYIVNNSSSFLDCQVSKTISSKDHLLHQILNEASSPNLLFQESVLKSKNEESFFNKSFSPNDNLKNNFQESREIIRRSKPFDLEICLYKEEKSKFLNNVSNAMPQKATPYRDCFPRHKLKFARGKKLLGNFEETILKGCLLPVSSVTGFRTEIGASGSFCPNHITLPADVSFYEMDNLYSGTTPYMAHVNLSDIEYFVPKKGAVQVTLFNPSETVVKVFVLNYDLSDMPPLSHTFIRQKTYYLPVESNEDCPSSPKWLRFILHLRFASSKSGKLYLHKDFKIVVLNKSNDDAASEFNQEPRELRSFLHLPMNPTFSNF